MKQKILYLIIEIVGLSLLSSCEKEVSLSFNQESELCINCILNPAKTIEARLTLSRDINETGEFSTISNATVELFENGLLLGLLSPGDSGVYTLNKKPVSGKHYKISVKAEGFNALTAESTVPQAPVIKYEKTNLRDEEYSVSRYDLRVELHDPIGKNYYWLYKTGSVNGKNTGGSSYPMNAPFIDDFNKQYDNDTRFGFTFFGQIRILDDGYDGLVMQFTIPDIPVQDNDKRKANQHFLGADEHYDKYIKTSIINQKKEQSDLPFYEPVQIYSNIQNGTGIFGSCAITTVKL